jgi:protein-disulfide isomerase
VQRFLPPSPPILEAPTGSESSFKHSLASRAFPLETYDILPLIRFDFVEKFAVGGVVVNRRVLLAAIVVVALLGARLSLSRGLRSAFSPRTSADRASLPASSETGMAPAPSTAVTARDSSTLVAYATRPPEPAKHDRTPAADPAPSRPAPPQTATVASDYDPHKVFGSKNAPVIMEVFSDFQCPACKTLFTTTNRQLMDNYVTVGKVFLIHRDYPLPMHAYSRVAARYARAAAQLGKTEVVEQALFQNQEKWEQTGDVDGTVAAVLSPAEMTKVRALVKSGTLEAAIDKDYALGTGYHVNQTPTTIIHSKGQTYPVVGVVTYDTLRSFLDQLLSQK